MPLPPSFLVFILVPTLHTISYLIMAAEKGRR